MSSLNEKGQVEGKLKAAITSQKPSRYDAFTDALGLDQVPRKEIREINKSNSSSARPVPPRSTRR